MSERTILLVEDNASDEALILRSLRNNNILEKVVVARDGAEALDYLFARGTHAGREDAALPHVVFLDLNLPKIGGLDVLRQIRADARTRVLPVVILTSSNLEQDIAAGYAAGTNSYVVKPVDFSRFSEAVGRVVFYWLHLNLGPPHPS